MASKRSKRTIHRKAQSEILMKEKKNIRVEKVRVLRLQGSIQNISYQKSKDSFSTSCLTI